MSGELVLTADAGGRLEALVRAVALLESSGLPRHALAGGLAVIVRLATPHRVTDDVDTICHWSGDEAAAADVLIARGARRSANGVVLPDGVRVDLIEVGEVEARDLPDEAAPRMFVLAHSWALVTATPATIEVRDGRGRMVAAAWVAEQARSVLVDEAERTVRWLRAGGSSPEMSAVDAADLRAVGEPFVSRLGGP